MQLTGRVVFWRDDKGFGFVVCDQTEQKLFFHIRDFEVPNPRPGEGDMLSFKLGQDRKNRPIAVALAVQQQAQPKASTNTTQRIVPVVDLDYTQDVALYFRCAFLVLVVIALLFGSLPYVLPVLYIEASLFTFWLYQADKNAAIARQSTRLPEQSLQLFSLIGGWPGALIAQKKLAHKRSKFLFQREFWLVVIGNSILLIWLLSHHGQQFLSRLALWS
jgi:uncharacterized membrane protein YsdA (DUF1294 family)/cold shock CspA family protein